MIIKSSNVYMGSQRNYQRNVKSQTTTTRWQPANPARMSSTTQSYSYSYSEGEQYNNYNSFARNLKNSRQNTLRNAGNRFGLGMSGMQQRSNNFDIFQETMNKSLRSILDILYRSKNMPQGRFSGYGSGYSYNTYSLDYTNSAAYLSSVPSTPPVWEVGSSIWNQVTDTYFSLEEKETTTFESTGTAITADGRKLEFDVSMTMSRSFAEEYASSDFMQYEQVLTDPLVINLDSNPTSLSSQHFYFDLDCDGRKEEISSLGAGSGFLAYDKNNDGIINDGSELFGTKSGNGFYDLSAYDEDGNGWIDEADDIYQHLKVWYKDENGNDKLISLKEADVGAIYLGSEKTQFSLTDKDNNLDGMVRSTGIFLKESGGSGTISQVDLARRY
ncbi:MAG: hypothetical protein NC086_06790 [Alistipes sp.]|nr:hypothetical protein [Alistipes sp.]